MRAAATIAAIAVLAVLGIGCGNSSLNADTSCSDFLAASPTEQDEAVNRIAGELAAGNAVTPLGRPNVNYICANNPDETLGEAIEATG